LLSGDGDGGEEGGFGGGGVGGVLFDEDFATDAMESGVEPMLSGLARQRLSKLGRAGVPIAELSGRTSGPA